MFWVSASGGQIRKLNKPGKRVSICKNKGRGFEETKKGSKGWRKVEGESLFQSRRQGAGGYRGGKGENVGSREKKRQRKMKRNAHWKNRPLCLRGRRLGLKSCGSLGGREEGKKVLKGSKRKPLVAVRGKCSSRRAERGYQRRQAHVEMSTSGGEKKQRENFLGKKKKKKDIKEA